MLIIVYIVGIDGGGTKTKGVIADEKGAIIATATVGATNPNSVTKEDLEVEFSDLFNQLFKKIAGRFSQVKRVFAGISGTEHPARRKEVEVIFGQLLPNDLPFTVVNDAIIALYSGTLGKPGIVQIGGTGSISYGLNERGEDDRVGGWSYLLGEKGSGYAIGSLGLDRAFQAYDGLGEQTMLTDLFLAHFHSDEMPDLIDPIYSSKNPKELIASLSRLVFQAADVGDAVAKEVIDQNAHYIGEAISCLIQKLFKDLNKQIPVVLTGGIFNRLDRLQQPMAAVFLKNNLDVQLIRPKMEPIGGAVVAGLLKEAVEVDRAFVRRFGKENF